MFRVIYAEHKEIWKVGKQSTKVASLVRVERIGKIYIYTIQSDEISLFLFRL